MYPVNPVFKYLRKAFTNSWNLLLFFGGLGFAAICGVPDIAIPMVLAAETAYLGFLGTHPKFQAYVNAQEAKSQRQATSVHNQEVLRRILKSLPPNLYDRYERLRQRCRDLQQIAGDLKDPSADDNPLSFESMQTAGLDRLLWVFLRLQFTQYSLERFFETISEEKLNADLERLKDQRSQLDDSDKSEHTNKIRGTLDDNIGTVTERIQNFKQAEGNYQFVKLELDRLENKIKSLAEMAVNRQEPNFISSQIDAVAHSMRDTERTMNDLQFVTGLGQVDEEVPELVSPPPIMIK